MPAVLSRSRLYTPGLHQEDLPVSDAINFFHVILEHEEEEAALRGVDAFHQRCQVGGHAAQVHLHVLLVFQVIHILWLASLRVDLHLSIGWWQQRLGRKGRLDSGIPQGSTMKIFIPRGEKFTSLEAMDILRSLPKKMCA